MIFKNNKKGNIVFDIFIIMLIIFTFIFSIILTYYIWNGFNTEIQGLPSSVASNEIKNIIDGFGNWFLFLDKLLPFAFVVMWIGVILLSIRTDPDHPLFFLSALVILIIFTFIAFIIVDVGTNFTDSDVLLTTSQALGNTYFFMHNFHYISFFVMLGSAVWFWGKSAFVTDGGSIER